MTNGTETMVKIKWVYMPADFLEEKISLEREGYSVEIDNGEIWARMAESRFEAQPGIREMIVAELDAYFLGLNLSRRKPFGIQGGTIIRIFPDGHTDTTLALQGVTAHVQLGDVDLKVVDNDGRVHDARLERKEAAKRIAQLSAKHSGNPTVRKILTSYYNSVKDPGNELVYLHEIWEALREKLQGRDLALSILQISEPELARFYELTCNLPLNQGRHRGLHENLQDATTNELSEARTIARKMIDNYFSYIEGGHGA